MLDLLMPACRDESACWFDSQQNMSLGKAFRINCLPNRLSKDYRYAKQPRVEECRLMVCYAVWLL
jgi:hypothetical protein